jgi:hypothetical protein
MKISSGGDSTPSDDIRKTRESLLLEALDSGAATPMTEQDWDSIRIAIRQNLSTGENLDRLYDEYQ